MADIALSKFEKHIATPNQISQISQKDITSVKTKLTDYKASRIFKTRTGFYKKHLDNLNKILGKYNIPQINNDDLQIAFVCKKICDQYNLKILKLLSTLSEDLNLFFNQNIDASWANTDHMDKHTRITKYMESFIQLYPRPCGPPYNQLWDTNDTACIDTATDIPSLKDCLGNTSLFTENYLILGGGPNGLMTALFLITIKPNATIILLDKRGKYERGSAKSLTAYGTYAFTFMPALIKYLKTKFNKPKFIEFIDKINEILKKISCKTFFIKYFEITLYEELKDKDNIFFIKTKNSVIVNKEFETGKLSLSFQELSGYDSEDDASHSSYFESDSKKLSLLQDLGITAIFNCTGGRLNTHTYWKGTKNDTKKFLLDFTNKQFNYVKEEKKTEIYNQITTDLNIDWFVRDFIPDLEKENITQNFDYMENNKLCMLKPAVLINCINSSKTEYDCPMFNIGDSIMRIYYKKKIGLGLAIANLSVIYDLFEEQIKCASCTDLILSSNNLYINNPSILSSNYLKINNPSIESSNV